MDITNEARVDAFAIGPSTIVGRTVAFRILLCGSAAQMRGRLARALRAALQAALPVAAWFHPKNTQGILVVVTLMAFLLRRRSAGVRARVESAYRRKFWRNMMRAALSYEEWAHAAKMLDKETLRASDADLYDEELVRNKLRELRHRREDGSLRDIVFCMRADLLRNLGNMCNPELHKGRLQVPKLIKEYIEEVSTQLKMVCDSDSDELPLEEKLTFMHETRHAFGRTALLLSGGASLGAFHVGVVKTLVEHKLLPRIIAGSSVGSIVCAIVATRSWPELESFFEEWQSLKFFDQMGGIFPVVKRIFTYGAVHDIRHLQMHLRLLTSNLTFQEAYDMTGRILGITVCSPRKHEPPRCLNYLTSPHVLIWSAVTASCAFPGLFEAQELMAKDRFGETVPFHAPFLSGMEECAGPSTRRWRDGSLESDLPMKQLKELFNVNHFIVSQANPHITPLLRLKELVRAYGGNFAAKLAELTEMEVKHRCNQVLELGFPLGGIAKLFAQDWEGDVTIVMPATLAQYSKIIQNPSYPELQKAANQGRRCTWEKLSAIKANCAIELALDECVALLNHMRRLKRSAERAAASHGYANTVKLCPSRRIPSWNIIARENSTGSLEEEILASPTRSNQQVTGVFAGPSNRNCHVQRSAHDSSDSESESIDLNSWTRSGGPLMRTASANKFINFVRNLEIDAEFRGISSREDEADAMTPSSNVTASQVIGREPINNSPRPITPDRSSGNSGSDSLEINVNRFPFGASTSIVVSEGDLLQPEKIGNGILLNVVRRETLLVSSNEMEQRQESSQEVDIETVQAECFDGMSASEDDEDDFSARKEAACASIDGKAGTSVVSASSKSMQHQVSLLEVEVDTAASADCQAASNTDEKAATCCFHVEMETLSAAANSGTKQHRRSTSAVSASSESVQHQGSSLEVEVDTAVSAYYQAESNNDERAAICHFDVGMGTLLAPVNSESGQHQGSSLEADKETMKTECFDGNSALPKDEADLNGIHTEKLDGVSVSDEDGADYNSSDNNVASSSYDRVEAPVYTSSKAERQQGSPMEGDAGAVQTKRCDSISASDDDKAGSNSDKKGEKTPLESDSQNKQHQQSLHIDDEADLNGHDKTAALCYDHSSNSTHGNLIESGEAVGVIAGQSIRAPRTQLRFRTSTTGRISTGGSTEHAQLPSDETIKSNDDLVNRTLTRQTVDQLSSTNNVDEVIDDLKAFGLML